MVRLTGREREARALEGALGRALSGEGGVVAVSGEAGIGKTTLARALGQVAAKRGVPLLWGRGVDSGAPAFWPWRQVVRGRMETVDDVTLRAEVGGGAGELVRAVPELGSRLGLEPSPLGEGRVRLFDAFASFLRRASRSTGLLVVLDDLQWADGGSLRLVEHLGEDLTSSRVLLLIAYRSSEGAAGEAVAALDAVRTVDRIGLRGLPVEAVHHELSSASGRVVSGALSARVHVLTGGNPLYLSELARLLAEDVSAGKPVDEGWPHAVPATVRALVRRRLGRLANRIQAVLHAAAVVGSEFSVAVVAAMVRVPAMACLGALDEAGAAGLVEASSQPGRQRFVHALIREAVHADLPAAEQVRLHLAAADALEAGADREIQPSAVAQHRATAVAVAADGVDPVEALRAAQWAGYAADEAMHQLAWEEAACLRRLALDLAGAWMDSLARCQLLLGLARALQRSGALAASVEACSAAADLARGVGRPDLLAQAALVVQGVGDPLLSPTLQRLAEEALSVLSNGPPATRSRLLAQLAEARLYQDDEEGTETHSRDALAQAELAGDRDTLIVALRARRLATFSPERADDTLELADRVLQLASGWSAADVRHAFWAHVWQAQVWFLRGRLDLVADELQPLAARAQELREPLLAAHQLRLRAILSGARGQLTHALEVGEAAQDAFARSGQATADGQHAGFRCSVARFAGYPPDLATALALPPAAAGPFADLGRLRWALALAGLGRRDEAATEYRRLDPVGVWRLPTYLRLTGWTLRLRAAVALEVLPDVAELIQLLAPHRGLHAGGGLSYDGPVELAVGAGAAALGRLDAAEADLTAALHWSRTQHARPFLVEAAVDLAGVRARRAGPADLKAARTLLDEAEAIATELAMVAFTARVQRLRSVVGPAASAASPLSAREHEVAQLVARGLTNRRIAQTLVLSERTAENHVQHILTKLGLDNRTQIAAWVASHQRAGQIE